jgi:NADPH:quinone reductase-like Zn-dependent oxidoreductase/acetyl esterase/lipase
VTVAALIVAGLLFLWMSLTYVTLPGSVPFLQRAVANAYALEVALVGVVGSVVAAVAGSLPAALAFAAVAVVAGIPVVRVWLAPDVLDELGWSLPPVLDWRRGPNVLRRPWGLRLRGVPKARVKKDVPFATPPGSARPLLCDLWQPALGIPPSGLAFVYFHGSSWVVFDKDIGTRTLFGRLAAQGHVVMDVAYRLYPETDIEGMVGDVRRSIAWMKAHGDALGVKADRIVVGGGSAGAHLALLAAYTEGNPELTPPDLYFTDAALERRRVDTSVRGVLAWYGPVDLKACYSHFHNDALAAKTPNPPDWNAPTPALLLRVMGPNANRFGFQKMGGGGRLDWILQGRPEQVPARYALLSPISHVRADCPPTLLMQGSADIIVPQASAEALRDKMWLAGAQMALLLLPRIDHAFDLFGTRWSPSARKSIWHAERFLELMARGAPADRHLGGHRGAVSAVQPGQNSTMTLMKAALCTSYGPPEVLVMRDVERPQPRADEMLVRIHASTVNSSDWFIRSGIPNSPAFTRMMMKLMIGARRPRRQILGLIVAGEVVEVGPAVIRFHVGDRVWAFTKFHLGGYAEYTCLRESSTVGIAPTGLSFDETAAILYGGLLALHFVRKGEVKPGMSVLLYGASSGVGTAAVQLAKHFGADVTAVCGTDNAQLMRSLGADHVLDYTVESTPPDGTLYDLVLDTVGKRKTSALRTACERALRPGGRVLSVDDGTPQLRPSDLALLKDLVESGELKPVIDRRYPLEQIVEAHRYVGQEHKKGNVVVTIAPEVIAHPAAVA